MKPYQNDLSIFLDDAILELQALIHNRPNSEKRAVQIQLPPSSSNDILHALEAADCLYTLS
jgi:hypothetical protein